MAGPGLPGPAHFMHQGRGRYNGESMLGALRVMLDFGAP